MNKIKLSIIFLFCFLCSIYSVEELKTDEDFINFAIKGDKILINIIFLQNKKFLKKHKLNDYKIETKSDLKNIMQKYWSEDIINKFWDRGSKLMPEMPYGFYSEALHGFLKIRKIKVINISNVEKVVSGEIPGYDEWLIRKLIIKKINNSWKITNIEHCSLEEK